MISDDKVKLEAYIARPPTSKCRQVIAILEETVHHYPDQLQLVVFERGAPWQEEPSHNLKYAIHKANTVPLCFAGGKLVAGGRVPTLDEVEHAVQKALHLFDCAQGDVDRAAR